MLTVNDTLVEKLLANYWAQSSPVQHSDHHIYSLELDPNNGSESLNAYLPMHNSLLPVCKPLAIELLDRKHSAKDRGILEWSQKAQMTLPALLASIPRIPGDDLQQSIDLLLGPPTVESLRYLVEVGLYLFSNNIIDIDESDDFITWMLRIVPWTVLKPILSTPVLTIQAFAESVFQVATSMGNVRIVTDLLQNPSFMSLVQSSGESLVRAVQTSNAELIRLLLDAGARPNLEWYIGGPVPLIEAKTVEIARMLVEAGAVVNAKGLARSIDDPGKWSVYTALCGAVWRNDVKLARYLISVGADVNFNDEQFCYRSPLMLAVCTYKAERASRATVGARRSREPREFRWITECP